VFTELLLGNALIKSGAILKFVRNRMGVCGFLFLSIGAAVGPLRTQ
jgi:hypothetical protein